MARPGRAMASLAGLLATSLDCALLSLFFSGSLRVSPSSGAGFDFRINWANECQFEFMFSQWSSLQSAFACSLHYGRSGDVNDVMPAASRTLCTNA